MKHEKVRLVLYDGGEYFNLVPSVEQDKRCEYVFVRGTKIGGGR